MSTPESETYDVNELGVEEFFNYHPSLALAIVALCLFVLGAAVLGYLTEKYKRRFVHTLTATGLLEAAGYAALIYCTVQSGKSSIFVACECQGGPWAQAGGGLGGCSRLPAPPRAIRACSAKLCLPSMQTW